MLCKVFAYVSFIVVLLPNADKHRAVALFCFLYDLILGVPPIHGSLVAGNLVMIELSLLLAGQAAILFLCKHQGLLDARCFDSFHVVHLFRRLPGRNRGDSLLCLDAGRIHSAVKVYFTMLPVPSPVMIWISPFEVCRDSITG